MVWGDRWLPPRSGCRSVAMVVAGAVALAATGGCGADDPVPDDQVPVIETRYETVTSQICDALDVDGIADGIEAIGSADSTFVSVEEDAYESEVMCRVGFYGADGRYDHYHWEFDPSGLTVVSVYHDLEKLERDHRMLLSGERLQLENRPGTTLEEIKGWWEHGVLRNISVVAEDGYDPSMKITRITSVGTIRHHNLVLQVVLYAFAPVGEDAVVAPLLNELTAGIVAEVPTHLALTTVPAPPEDD